MIENSLATLSRRPRRRTEWTYHHVMIWSDNRIISVLGRKLHALAWRQSAAVLIANTTRCLAFRAEKNGDDIGW